MALCTDKKGFDKIYHLILGGVICLIVGVLVAHIPPHLPWLTVGIALSAVLVAAICWEFYRKRKLPGNHICIWDILWTLAGGFAICWLPWLAAYLLAIDG